MFSWIRDYTRWLHTQWPAGTVEKLPVVAQDGSTRVPGVYVVGDLAGVPLLKFSADSGARAVETITSDPAFRARNTVVKYEGHAILDLVIVGGGTSGVAAAIEAKKHGLDFRVIEAAEPFSTIINFPKGKPIFTYPTEMVPSGILQFPHGALTRESLIAVLRKQAADAGIEPVIARVERIERHGHVLEVVTPGEPSLYAHRVVVAIGRSGNYRRLGVAGEELDKVTNRLHDPKDHRDQDVAVIGGGDSALETAIALASCGSRVTLSYRKPTFSRPKPENIEGLERFRRETPSGEGKAKAVPGRPSSASGMSRRRSTGPGSIRLMMGSRVKEIREREVVIADDGGTEETLPNDAVFTMLGREAPLDFFRRSGVPIRGEWRVRTWLSFVAFFLFCIFLYHWKKDAEIPIHRWFVEHGWFPFQIPAMFDAIGGGFAEAAGRTTNLLYTFKLAMGGTGFYYGLAYCVCVVVFGVRRIRRSGTPYVKAQTQVLILIQCLALFLLPELLLPWLGRNGWFAGDGSMAWLADQFFERYDTAGVERAYWRSYGLILAWPLFPWNAWTATPLWGWIILGSVQTFVVIPWMVLRWGKGAYCGWICPCGALAETLGDAHRHKMPHGPVWNKLNMAGQVILAIAILLTIGRVVGWIFPGSFVVKAQNALLGGIPFLNYRWLVDLMLAGVIGVGCYFWFSGRVWCRFACPLAALMHVYARFGRFRILAEKKKCISCNVCTTVCHQGIDVMNFANKGAPMEDPQCVRCSACVQSCPTGVLTFGQVDPKTGKTIKTDRLPASRVQMAEEARSHGSR